jgi:hypothetical protein
LYEGELAADWEPGDLPQIRSGCKEVSCQTCDGLGLVWQPVAHGGEALEDFTYIGEGVQVFVGASTMPVSSSNIYDWDEATSTSSSEVALTLVKKESEKED